MSRFPRQIDIRRIQHPVFPDAQAVLVDRIGNGFRGRAAVADVVLDAEVPLGAGRVVAGGQDDSAEGAMLADDAGRGRCGQNAVPAHQDPAEVIGGGHFQNDLDCFAIVVAAITAHYQGLAGKALQTVKDALHEVRKVMGLLEGGYLLAQAGSAGLLVGEGHGLDV